MMSRTVLSIVLCLIACTSFAQMGGFFEDFSDNSLAGWGFDGSTFTLSATDGALRIAYHRTAASGEWDNFNLMLPSINVGFNSHLQLKAKSTVATQLTLKPIYANGTDDWLPKGLPADNAWHTYTFALAKAHGTAMTHIYFYLDGGSTTPASGTVWLDDLRIGDQVSVDIDRSKLEQVILDATVLLGNSQEGSNEGQFAPGSKALLQSVVDSAKLVLGNKTASQTAIDQAVSSLHDACQTFETTAAVGEISVVDPGATKETKYLFSNLAGLSGDHLLFGHQDTTACGVSWWDEDRRSDIKDVCGSFPAVYGWDVGQLELGGQHNLDGVEFERMRFWIRAAYTRGGISTISWHSTNPVSRGNAWDVSKAVSHILPGGAHHDEYRAGLDHLARFFKSLRAAMGNSIPIIFRPFHENTGSWFWWGKNHCTATEFISLWQFTVEYLRDEKGVHNLLYAYSPDSSPSDGRTEYMRRYPGDDYVDVLGLDDYALFHRGDTAKGLQWLRMIAELANEKNKVSAITELGLDLGNEHCWTDFLNVVKSDLVAREVVWMLVWGNANTSHFFGPYPGQTSAPDFVQFRNDPYMMFESDLPDMYALGQLDVVKPEFEDFESGQFSAIGWQHGGDLPWSVTSDQKHAGRYSARAGAIGHSQASTLRITGVCAAGTFSFYFKTSTESGDNLVFRVDGQQKAAWSGSSNWKKAMLTVIAGTHTFEWSYVKDASASGGQDTVWIDDVVFP